MGGSKLQHRDDDEEYDFKDEIQNAVINKTLLEKLNVNDTLAISNLLNAIQIHPKTSSRITWVKKIKFIGDLFPKSVAAVESRKLSEEELGDIQGKEL